MTVKVGGVEFDVDVDTSGATTASTKLKKELDSLTGAFDDIDSATDKAKTKLDSFTASITESGKKISAAGKVYDAFGVEVKDATAELESLSAELAAATAAAEAEKAKIESLTTSLESASGAYSVLSTGIAEMAEESGRANSTLATAIARQISLGNTIDDNNRVIDANGNEVVEATEALKKYATQATALNGKVEAVETAFTRMTTASSKGSGSLSNLSRNAGQAGVQIQQFVGQIQGGQSAMLALSQQSADLGYVLGFGGVGAAVGIAATAISFLISDTDSATTASERLEEALSNLNDIVETSADGINQLSEQVRKLAEYSEDAAMAKITLGIIEAQDAAKEAASSIQDMFGELDADYGFSGIDDMIDALNSTNHAVASGASYTDGFKEVARELGEEFGYTGSEAQSLGSDIIKLAAVVKSAPTPENFERLNDALLDAKKSAPNASEAINRFIGEIQNYFLDAQTAAEKTEFLRSVMNNLGIAIDGGNDSANSSIKSMNSSLTSQIIALTSGAQAAELYAAGQAAIKEGTEDQLPETLELINRKYELKAAQEAAAKTAKEEAAAIKERTKAEQEYMETLDAIFANQEAQDAERKNKVTTEYESMASGMEQKSPLEQLEEELEAKRQLTNEYYALQLEDKQLTDEQFAALEQQKQDMLSAIDEKGAKAREDISEAETNAKLSMMSSMFSNLSSLMNTESRKLFEIGKAGALASAIVSGYQAVATTMKETPYPYNIPLAAAQAAASFAQVQGIMSTQYGSTSTGQSYSSGTVATNTTSTDSSSSSSPTQNITISMTGGDDAGRSILSLLNATIRDGGTLITT